MKIATIVSTFPPYQGGMGNSAYEFSRLLAREHNVRVFTLASGNSLPHPGPLLGKEREPVHVVRLTPKLSFGFKNGGFIPQLHKRLQGFDVIYLHYPFFGGAEVVWLFKLFNPKIKLVIHFHMDTPALSLWGKFLSMPSLLIRKSLFKRADKVIVSSFDYAAHASIKHYFQKWPDKFCEIPYGVHLDKFHVYPHDISELQCLREKYGIGEKDRVVMFLGGLDSAHAFKGVDVLLQAMAGRNDKNQSSNYSPPASLALALRAGKSISNTKYQTLLTAQSGTVLNTKLLICGNGDKRIVYEKLAKDLGIGEQVVFAGRVLDEELALHYNLADIFVLPSTDMSEAFGMVLLEAMACGVPVMASNLPGVRSVFVNGVQGYTVAPNSARNLRAKLEEYLKYPQRRLKMGRAARELVEERYSWERVGERVNYELRIGN